MNPIEFIAQDIFDKIRSRFENLEMGDADGSVSLDPALARFFDFDFVIEGNRLGRVSISINEIGSLKIFYGQGILEDADAVIQEYWYNFLKEMRNFAKRRLLRFDTRDITKANLNKTDFKYLASKGTKEETMQESKLTGSSMSSYLPLEKTRMIIRHTGKVDETIPGSRTRKIKCIYIENEAGERYKMPNNHRGCAEAIQRHVANGGRPYDAAGQEIMKMGEQLLQLSAFKRKVGHHDSMNNEASDIVERANMKLLELKKQMRVLSKQRGYEHWMAGQQLSKGEQPLMEPATLEDYKNRFAVTTYNEELDQYFPLLYSIMQETGEIDLETYIEENSTDEAPTASVKEDAFAAFESWANSIVEAQQLTPDVVAALKKLKDSGLQLGVDGVNATQSLQRIGIDDSNLFAAFAAMAPVNSTADAFLQITPWLEKYDPDAAKQLAAAATAPTAPAAAPQEGLGGIAGGIAGAALTKSPAGAMQGYAVGNELEHDLTDEEASAPKTKMRKVAELVKSFYDASTGQFPMGETGVIIKVTKEFGDAAGQIASKLVHELVSNNDDSHQLNDIVRLSGGALDRVAARAQSRKTTGDVDCL